MIYGDSLTKRGMKLYDKGNTDKAIELYQKAWDKYQDPEALFKLAFHMQIMEELGKEINKKQKVEYFDIVKPLLLEVANKQESNQLYLQNVYEAQCFLGMIYYHGYGTTKVDIKSTIKWFEKSLFSEDINILRFANYYLGECYFLASYKMKDDKKAFEYFIKSAELGSILGMSKAGAGYLLGLGGVKKDYKKAFEYLNIAVAKGIAEAQYIISTMYIDGLGMKKDKKRGIEYLELSAKQGYENAINLLKELNKK